MRRPSVTVDTAQSITTSSEPTVKMEGEPQVGDHYIVKRFNGITDEKFVASVVAVKEVNDEELEMNRYEKRTRNLVDRETEKRRYIEASSSSNRHTLYYVHYDGMDRRLDEWVEVERFVEPTTATEIEASGTVENGSTARRTKLTRSQRRINEEFNHQQKSYLDMGATTAKLEREHEERTKFKNIEAIVLGDNEINTWYFSPYPKPFGDTSKLFICEFCLSYFMGPRSLCTHMLLCSCRNRTPPGDEVYRKDNLAVYQVCGRMHRSYAQCMCLLSKLFMDHKTLYYDVDSFLFYVICEVDDYGSHIVGNFSKERVTENNLACIMILPPYQRKGYGKLLIQLSYELSYREGWIGTPEKPLSDLGKVSYRSYWWWVLLEAMEKMGIETIRVNDLSEMAGIARDDIISTLQPLQITKYWKGDYVIRASKRILDHCRSLGFIRVPTLMLDSDALLFEPPNPRGPPRKRLCLE